MVEVSVVYGHLNIKVAGGAVAHLIGLTSELINILRRKRIDYEVNVVFAGRVSVKEVIQSLKSLDENVEVVEANMYRRLYREVGALQYFFFPMLGIRKEGFKRFREALRKSDIIISRSPHFSSVALAYWTALILSKPRDAILIEEHFGNPYWSSVELDATSVARKIKANVLSLPSSITTDVFACLFADKVFVISEGGGRVLTKEVPFFLRERCRKKIVALYPPVHKVTRLPSGRRSKEGVTICTSGSFYPHQGYKDLVKLVYVLNELFDGERKVKFKLMGAPIQAADIIKPLLQGYSNVEFGYIKDKKKLYETYATECDAFLALYDPFRVLEFYGAPAKLADFVLFKKPIIMWDTYEYNKTIEVLTERCDCVRRVKSFEELLEEVLKLMKEEPRECECVVKERSRSSEVLEEIIDEVLSRKSTRG